jgi:hypothetical protein
MREPINQTLLEISSTGFAENFSRPENSLRAVLKEK